MKDRLEELKRKSSLKERNKQEEISIDTPDDDELHEILKEVELIRGWINEINEKTLDMRKIYSNTTFNFTPKLKEEMDANIAACKALGTKACFALRDSEKRLNESGTNNMINRIMHIQYTTTRKLFSDALKNHEKFLEDYKNNRMTLLKKQVNLTNQSFSEEEFEELLSKNYIQPFVDNHCLEIREAQMTLRILEERHDELLKIENALIDVKNMFTQLAILVHLQQDHIDTVEYFATKATDCVDLGTQSTKKFKEFRKKAREKRFIIVICLTIVIIILLLLIVI